MYKNAQFIITVWNSVVQPHCINLTFIALLDYFWYWGSKTEYAIPDVYSCNVG